MPLKGQVRYRIKTYSSGKRVRIALIGDRVVETKSMPSTKPTKSKRSLARRRRRIGR